MKKISALILIILLIVFYNNGIFTEIKSIFIDNNNTLDMNVKDDKKNESINEKEEIDNFQYIKIGDSKDYVISKIGEPSRIDASEYSFNWYVYNQYKGEFAMVGIENDIVVALFSNTMNSCEAENIKLDDSKQIVNDNYDSIEYRKKGNTRYMINSKGEYDIIKQNKKYITVFYDLVEGSKVCSYQIINQKTEDSMKDIYANESEELKKSFELQIIDLINSSREKYNLNKLKYSEKATISSRKHSEDMMNKDYFDHVNKEKETPFDRMKKEGITYISAGENIASGQFNAIYAHEALMNSKGHRKNILGNYKYIGVGVDFGGTYKIYYTENFYT